MIFDTPTPPIAGCIVCGAADPKWYGHDGWLCASDWDDLQDRRQTVYSSYKSHTLLMFGSLASSAVLVDQERAQWLWSASAWLEENLDGDDVRFVLLGHVKVFEEPTERVADCVTAALAKLPTSTPFLTLFDRLADAVRRTIGPDGTGS